MSALYVWGIEPAAARLAFACAPVEDGSLVVGALNTASEATEGERLGLLDRQTRIFARQLAGDFPPVACCVGQPSRCGRGLALVYAAGVVQAALFEVLGVPIWTLPPSAWKSRAVGSSNATKAQVSAWAQGFGATVNGQNEANACAIAVAGREVLAGERSALGTSPVARGAVSA